MPTLHRPSYGTRALAPTGAVMRCASWRRLPYAQVMAAQNRVPTGHVDASVQCLLFDGHEGQHFGLVDSLEYGPALWARWLEASAELVELPDCAETGPPPDPAGCCLFTGHAERHTWEASCW
ncbi:hypothetical protein ACH4OW_36110 [Streptomyces sp. NPDC017056]|uniref:hypothetical protein n=1 Tax=Streptomyces sp. NPDC017056 TaxID=3364973 RepID=UPI00378854A9